MHVIEAVTTYVAGLSLHHGGRAARARAVPRRRAARGPGHQCHGDARPPRRREILLCALCICTPSTLHAGTSPAPGPRSGCYPYTCANTHTGMPPPHPALLLPALQTIKHMYIQAIKHLRALREAHALSAAPAKLRCSRATVAAPLVADVHVCTSTSASASTLVVAWPSLGRVPWRAA